MPATLLDLIRQANEDLRDFLSRAGEFPASPGLLMAVHVQSLTSRLASLGDSLRAAAPEVLASTHSAHDYIEYKDLLARVYSVIGPLHGQLLVRQVQISLDRSQIRAARSWSEALARTR